MAVVSKHMGVQWLEETYSQQTCVNDGGCLRKSYRSFHHQLSVQIIMFNALIVAYSKEC